MTARNGAGRRFCFRQYRNTDKGKVRLKRKIRANSAEPGTFSPALSCLNIVYNLYSTTVNVALFVRSIQTKHMKKSHGAAIQRLALSTME